MAADPKTASSSVNWRRSRGISKNEEAWEEFDELHREFQGNIPMSSSEMCAINGGAIPPDTLFYDEIVTATSDLIHYRNDQGEEMKRSPFTDPDNPGINLSKNPDGFGFLRHGNTTSDQLKPVLRSSMKKVGACLPDLQGNGSTPEETQDINPHHRGSL